MLFITVTVHSKMTNDNKSTAHDSLGLDSSLVLLFLVSIQRLTYQNISKCERNPGRSIANIHYNL